MVYAMICKQPFYRQKRIMSALDDEGELTPHQLALQIDENYHTIINEMWEMVSLGWLGVRPNPNKRDRGNLFRLTAKGFTKLLEVTDILRSN